MSSTAMSRDECGRSWLAEIGIGLIVFWNHRATPADWLQDMTNQYRTALPDGSSFFVETAEGVFQPTLTSELCLKAFWKENKKGRVLDLGCGCGLVGLAAARSGTVEPPVCASHCSNRGLEKPSM